MSIALTAATAPKALLSAAERLAIAIGTAAFVATICLVAGQASQKALLTASAALSRDASPSAAFACAARSVQSL